MNALQRLLAELGAAAVIGLLLFGLGHHGGYKAGLAKRDEAQAAWDAERAQLKAAALAATTEARTEEARRTAATQEIAHEAQTQIDQARADAATAAVVADGLRRAAGAAATRGCAAPSNPAAAPAGPPDPAAGLVLADVLGRADQAAGELAAAADAAHAAGAACERAYGALSTVTK
jgi:hypothetical protein